MPVTLADLRALMEKALTHTENPAILRLPEKERTAEGLARVYLARGLWVTTPDHGWTGHPRPQLYWRFGDRVPVDSVLDLTDPGTAHAILVALALGMGLDPDVGGLACMWTVDGPTDAGPYSHRSDRSYRLVAVSNGRRFCSAADYPRHHALDIREPDEDDEDREPSLWRTICAPTVANEPDPIRALELAVRRVLEGR